MRTFLHLTQIANKKHTPEEDVELAETFRLLLESPDSDERARDCALASLRYFIHLQKRRPGMMNATELKKEIAKQKGDSMDKYDGLYAFFEEEITEFREKEGAELYEKGRDDGIYNTIYRNLQTKYGANAVSKRLNDKIDAINFYPALEEIQIASWSTPSLVAFEREVDKIAKQYEAEIQERRR